MMKRLWRGLRRRLGGGQPPPQPPLGVDTVELLRGGWDSYAGDWRKMLGSQTIPALEKKQHGSVRYLGDEWTVMNTPEGGYYGVDFASSKELLDHLDRRVLSRHLTSRELTALEVGPGGGRFTELLLSYSREVICTDVSEKMLGLLRERFADEPRVKYLQIDGLSLAGVEDESVECVASFDTFVHIEPRQIYNYLTEFHRVMKPGGVGIIHHANVDSEIGWKIFMTFMRSDLRFRASFASFTIMNPGLMKTFVERAGFDTVALDTETLPRDCIAVFRKP